MYFALKEKVYAGQCSLKEFWNVGCRFILMNQESHHVDSSVRMALLKTPQKKKALAYQAGGLRFQNLIYTICICF